MRKLSTAIVLVAVFVSLIFIIFPLSALAGKIKGTVKVQGLRTAANVVVYLSKAPPTDLDFSKVKFVMDQRNLEFRPHVLPVLVGTTVQFPNNDEVSHNVFSLSRTRKFNLGSYSPGENKSVTFDKPGIVELRCDVHAEMAAYIMVMRNPYFAITDSGGRFEIPDSEGMSQVGGRRLQNMPPGRYTIKTWHEKLKSQKKVINVPETGRASIQFALTRGTPSVLYK